jgi:hypothetical protein
MCLSENVLGDGGHFFTTGSNLANGGVSSGVVRMLEKGLEHLRAAFFQEEKYPKSLSKELFRGH